MKLIGWWGVALIGASLMLGIAIVMGWLGGYDRSLLRGVALTRAQSSGAAIVAAQAVTQLGDASVRSFFVIAALTVLVVRRCWRSALAFLVTVAVTIAAYSVAKEVFARARPTVVPWLDNPTNLSYPSGHAAGSMVVLLLGALLIGRRAMVAAAVVLALAIGVSRPLLGVHWPSDVIGGWLFGAGGALLGLAWARRVQRPRGGFLAEAQR